MRIRTLLGIVLVAGAALGLSAAAPAATPAPAAFEITLVRTSAGWSATCGTGCAWSAVSMECAPGCQAVISHSGMRTQRVPELNAEPFAFVVEPRGVGGWQAVSIRGTAWSETGIACGGTRCRVRVDGTGVSRL